MHVNELLWESHYHVMSSWALSVPTEHYVME